MNYLKLLDFRLFEFFNAFAGKNRIFDKLVIFLGYYLVFILGAVLIAYWVFAKDKTKARQALFSAFVAFVAARFVVVEIIRKVVPRARPFLSHQVIQLISKDAEKSFPSGHAAALFAIAAAFYFYDKKLAGWLFALAVLVSIARVIGGVHYPADIFAGAIVGILSAWLLSFFFKQKFDIWAGKISQFYDRILPFTKR